MDEVREVKLKRSDSIGLGFSVFGGKGSGFPPVIYQVVDKSPADISGVLEAGDVILEVNDKDVVSLTTKEVLKCLRLSNDVVTLKVKKDASVRERVHHHMAASTANGAHENGENIPPAHHRQQQQAPPKQQPKFESFTMTGELIIKTKSSNFKNFKEQPPNSLHSRRNDEPKANNHVAIPPFVRTSRSEDFLQQRIERTTPDDDEVGTTTSLHNLLDSSPSAECATSWSCTAPVTSTGAEDTRTGQFIHVPPATLGEEKSAEDTSRVLRGENGVTRIVVDENAVCLQVSAAGDPSPPESDAESLSSFHYSPKAVDAPSASRLAKRLFHLEGFKKADVSRHLCKNNDFSRVVADEYLSMFSFDGEGLDAALRHFLRRFCLIGETQERERVLAHFSKRFLECNPAAFKSQDAVHTLTCALMLLNTDLHGENVGRRMSCGEFISNLSGLNEGGDFSREVLKALYHAVKNSPLEWATDDEEEDAAPSADVPVLQPTQQRAVGHNPFLEVPNPNCATEYKKGYVMRKCCVDANGKKTPMGKRGWKMFYADLRDLVLYLHKDESGVKRHQLFDSVHNAVRVHHALATRATDYTKKQHVFRLATADGALYLFQTSDSKELQSWIDTLNSVAASLSAPSLEAGVGPHAKFQRPLLPAAPTKLNFRDQLLEIESRVLRLERELEEHHAARGSRDHAHKEHVLQHELKRYRTYHYLLRSKVSQFPPDLEPSLAGTAIGEEEELSPPSSTDNNRFSYRAAIYRTGE